MCALCTRFFSQKFKAVMVSVLKTLNARCVYISVKLLLWCINGDFEIKINSSLLLVVMKVVYVDSFFVFVL